MSNPTNLPISNLTDGGGLKTSDYFPVSRDNSTYKVQLLLQNTLSQNQTSELGVDVEQTGRLLMPAFVDNVTIKYDSTTNKIYAVGGGGGGAVNSVSAGNAGITVNQTTGNVQVFAKVDVTSGLKIDNTNGITLNYNSEFSVSNNQLQLSANSNASKLNNLSLSPNKYVTINAQGNNFDLVDLPSFVAIKSINNQTGENQTINTDANGFLSVDSTDNTHTINYSLGSGLTVTDKKLLANVDNSSIGFNQTNAISIKNSNLISLGALTLTANAGKFVNINSSADGFSLSSAVAQVSVGDSEDFSPKKLNFIAGSGCNIVADFLSDILNLTISATGGGGDYQSGDGILVSGNTISINLDTASALVFDNSQPTKKITCKALVNELGALDTSTAQQGYYLNLNANKNLQFSELLLSSKINTDEVIKTQTLGFIAGNNITLTRDVDNNIVIASTGGGSSYTAGDGIDIINNAISARLVENSGLKFTNGQIDTKTFLTNISNITTAPSNNFVLQYKNNAYTLDYAPIQTNLAGDTPSFINNLGFFAGTNVTITKKLDGDNNFIGYEFASTGGGAGVSSFQGSQQGSTLRTGPVTAEIGDYNATIIRLDNTSTSETVAEAIAGINESLISSVEVSGGNVTGQGTIANNKLTLNLTAPTSSSSNISFSAPQLVGTNALLTGLNYADSGSVTLVYRCISLGANASLSAMNFQTSAVAGNKISLAINMFCFADNTIGTPTTITADYDLYAVNNANNSLVQVATGNISFQVNPKDNKVYITNISNANITIDTNMFVLAISGVNGGNSHVGLTQINLIPTIS